MDRIEQAVQNIDRDNAERELDHIETSKGKTYMISDAAIDAWFDK